MADEFESVSSPVDEDMASQNGGDHINIDAAVGFAARFGLPNIMTFADGKCLHPGVPTSMEAKAFLNSHGDKDIYFTPAALRDAFTGKPKKTDCIGSEWAWADIDPPKGMINVAELEAWRARVLAEIECMQLPQPQIIVSSGRGLWLFWRLSCRMPVEAVEAINFGLAKRLGADDCWNIDRVARLPFTRNSKTGEIARVLVDRPGYTDPDLLPSEEPPSKSRDGDNADLGDMGEVMSIATEDDFREMVAGLTCPEHKKSDLILSAMNPEAANLVRSVPLNTSDRSAVMFSWAIKALAAGMPPDRVRDCILSPALEPISAHMLDAKKYPPSRRDQAARRQVSEAHAFAVQHGLIAVSTAEAEDTGQAIEPVAPGAPAPAPIKIVSLAAVPDDLPPRPWLVENLLMDGQVTMLTGRGGEGKSLLGLQIAIAVAAGTRFAWWNARQPRKVLVLNAEDGFEEQQRRLLGACDVMGLDPRLLTDRLFMLNAESFVLLGREPEKAIVITQLYGQLLDVIEREEIGLVIIDPLVEAHAGLDENSNIDMKELIVALRRMARWRSIPLLLVHHSRKSAVGGDQDGARGASALVNACRIVVTLERMTEEERKSINPPQPKERYVRATGAKANYAGRIGDRWLELVPVTLPNGDEAPGFKRVEFGNVEEGFDPQTWERREEFLQMVLDGRGEGRLWSAAATGKKEARLDAAVSQRFSLDAKQAHAVIERFRDARLIRVVVQKDSDRKARKVWATSDQELPPETEELPF